MSNEILCKKNLYCHKTPGNKDFLTSHDTPLTDRADETVVPVFTAGRRYAITASFDYSDCGDIDIVIRACGDDGKHYALIEVVDALVENRLILAHIQVCK